MPQLGGKEALFSKEEAEEIDLLKLSLTEREENVRQREANVAEREKLARREERVAEMEKNVANRENNLTSDNKFVKGNGGGGRRKESIDEEN